MTTVYLAVTLIAFTWRTFSFGETSQDSFTPLWIPQSVLCVGAVILAIQMLVRTLASLVGGRVDRPQLGAATAIEG